MSASDPTIDTLIDITNLQVSEDQMYLVRVRFPTYFEQAWFHPIAEEIGRNILAAATSEETRSGLIMSNFPAYIGKSDDEFEVFFVRFDPQDQFSSAEWIYTSSRKDTAMNFVKMFQRRTDFHRHASIDVKTTTSYDEITEGSLMDVHMISTPYEHRERLPISDLVVEMFGSKGWRLYREMGASWGLELLKGKIPMNQTLCPLPIPFLQRTGEKDDMCPVLCVDNQHIQHMRYIEFRYDGMMYNAGEMMPATLVPYYNLKRVMAMVTNS